MIGISGGLLANNENESFFKLENTYKELLKNRTFFLSFSENRTKGLNKSFGYDRSRMWSQYGEHHKGLCLIFSKSELLKKLELEKNDNNIIAMRGIKYKKHLPLKGIVLKRSMLKDNDYTQTILNFIDYNIDNICFTKTSDYLSENENRLIIIDPLEKNDYKYVDIIKSIKGVILGDNMPELYESMFMKVKEIYKIDILKTKYLNDQLFIHEPESV